MDNRAEVREFLTSRRAKITPHQAGLLALLASWASDDRSGPIAHRI